MLSSVSFLCWADSVEGAVTFQNLMVSVELILIYFHGRVFGVPRYPRRCHSFCGQLRGVRFSQLITSTRGVYC